MRVTLISFLLLVLNSSCFGQQDTVEINVTDYGIHPDSRVNVEPEIRKLLKENRNARYLKLVFPRGRYDFYPNKDREDLSDAPVGIEIRDRSGVCIDGQGSEFVFHGKMMAFNVQNAEGITLRNFSIDWDRPLISQAEIVGYSDTFLDLKIDKNEYPYEIKNDILYFTGEEWKSKIGTDYNNIFNAGNKDLVYETTDNPLGEIWNATAELRENGLVRLHFPLERKPERGTLIALYHDYYITDGIQLMRSSRLWLEQINIYHALSVGVGASECEDITLKQVNIIANEKKNRVFSTVADATHFNGCKGRIVIDSCKVTGAGDDFINIHGMYAPVVKVLSDHEVLLAPNDRYIGFEKGDKAWRVDTATMQRRQILSVAKQEDVSKGYRLTFTENITNILKRGDLLENIDKNPDVEITNCQVMKRHRARGILVTSPGKVRISNNYFNTAGSAILIEGDRTVYYESGAVRDVAIENNVFENSYTSEWGEGVITITPSITPKDSVSPAYHHNIRITGNTFKHYDYALLYARSVDTLVFSSNKIIYTNTYPPFSRKVNVYLDGCRHVTIGDNIFDAAFPGKNVRKEHMKETDLKQFGSGQLEVLR
ncbi:right-handed parallel beta-helix repeat-containing protein [Chitinophaga sp. 22321]|uniref:Right-handed parallel beta-helix repeat-containing protein n=1 Tax=Chitinophaga hostae TaxID=2831022 RepID=A0ABS5IZL5_9BACT|nr:right-handed parallel beta-helix repeat-containing protein [Chitinophaga hostae]MBS0028221.1 right-handed parallel beta-helix repeat-containing protein [Chitinophaga hostae]